MKPLAILLAAAVGMAIVGCSEEDDNTIVEPPTVRTEATMTYEAVSATPPSTLQAPAADGPTAGICLGLPEEIEIVGIVLKEDVPDPRCLEVFGSQRLRIVNERAESVHVTFGSFELAIPPAQGRLLDLPFEDYLMRGTHVIQMNGSGFGEVWLNK